MGMTATQGLWISVCIAVPALISWWRTSLMQIVLDLLGSKKERGKVSEQAIKVNELKQNDQSVSHGVGRKPTPFFLMI
jgi:hypothetical protein